MFCTVSPFITDYLWNVLGEEESIHLSKWPEFNEKKINKNLEGDFSVAMQIIEKGLAIRDKEQIGLKWPLMSAQVSMEKSKIGEELKEIIKSQLNVKKLSINRGGSGISVILDLKKNPELEAEGFAREISRRVQAERKKRGLQKADNIELKLYLSSELKERLKKHFDFIKQRTGSNSIFVVDKKINSMVEFKVKNKEIYFIF